MCIATGGDIAFNAAFSGVFSSAAESVLVSVVDEDVVKTDELEKEEVVKVGSYEKGLVAGLLKCFMM